MAKKFKLDLDRITIEESSRDELKKLNKTLAEIQKDVNLILRVMISRDESEL